MFLLGGSDGHGFLAPNCSSPPAAGAAGILHQMTNRMQRSIMVFGAVMPGVCRRPTG